MEEEIIKKYELLLIFVPDISEQNLKTELDEMREFLQKNTKGIFHEDAWGLKELAYQIKRFPQGYYVIFYFNALPEQIAEIRNAIRINPKLIRNLLIILPPDYEIKKYELEAEKKELPKEEKKPKKPKEMEEKAEEVVAEIEKKTVEEPLLKGETKEEKLEAVEKTLEDILENPDIKLK